LPLQVNGTAKSEVISSCSHGDYAPQGPAQHGCSSCPSFVTVNGVQHCLADHRASLPSGNGVAECRGVTPLCDEAFNAGMFCSG